MPGSALYGYSCWHNLQYSHYINTATKKEHRKKLKWAYQNITGIKGTHLFYLCIIQNKYNLCWRVSNGYKLNINSFWILIFSKTFDLINQQHNHLTFKMFYSLTRQFIFGQWTPITQKNSPWPKQSNCSVTWIGMIRVSWSKSKIVFFFILL